MNNIAEGFDATSSKAFIRFLIYSIQSCSEVLSMTYILLDVYKLDEERIKSFQQTIITERKQLKGFVKYLRKKDL
ncbi:MAG: four helix bundle protein [Candidatus Marinimicrobia bacterium]|nr:four helix bundle protein [Candidatus Neomarinimicrobiota bacterium]